MADDEHLERVRLLRAARTESQGDRARPGHQACRGKPAGPRSGRPGAASGPGANPGRLLDQPGLEPLYVFGPYDDHRPVIRTLKRNVGRGNFEVVSITG